VRLIGATVVASVAIAFVRSQPRGAVSWIVRLTIAALLFVTSIWMVYRAFPYPAVVGSETFSIVATIVLVAGLAVDELIGADVRRMLGM
jgi:cytochrome c oxidase assembly factor CtaG